MEKGEPGTGYERAERVSKDKMCKNVNINTASS